jgi:hypothetical protein
MLYYYMSSNRASSFQRSAIQFLRHFREGGGRSALVTLDGRAPVNIISDTPVIDESAALKRMIPGDVVVVDAEANVHVSGDRPVHVMLHRRDTDALQYYCFKSQKFRPTSIRLGRSAAAHFHYAGQVKHEDVISVDVPPNNVLWSQCFNQRPAMDYVAVGDGVDELEVAQRMCRSNIFLMVDPLVSPQRYVEAMSAGAVPIVVRHRSLPGIVSHGVNAWTVASGRLAKEFDWLLKPEQAVLRMSLRHGALATAVEHDDSRHRTELRDSFREFSKTPVAA